MPSETVPQVPDLQGYASFWDPPAPVAKPVVGTPSDAYAAFAIAADL